MTTRAASVRASASESRRQQILDAALSLFDQTGYANTTVEDIRDASEASVGSIYHHFDSKEGVAAVLYARAIDAYQAEALRILERAGSAREGITGVVRHFVRWVETSSALARLMLLSEYETARRLARPEVETLNRTFLAKVDAWLQTYAHEMKNLPPDVLLRAVLGGAHRYAQLWLIGVARTSPRKAADTLADHAWSGLEL